MWTDELAKRHGYRDYREYLESDHWIELKARYRSEWPDIACIACGFEWVQLHHLSYDRFGEERLRDLIPLCSGCHHKVHSFLRTNRHIKLSDAKSSISHGCGISKTVLERRLGYFFVIGRPTAIKPPSAWWVYEAIENKRKKKKESKAKHKARRSANSPSSV